mgnify:CR=1 FL=1
MRAVEVKVEVQAELQAQVLKLRPTLRCLAQAACQHKTKCKPEEYFKQWRSSAHCAKDVSKERWQLLQSFGKMIRWNGLSANLLRSAKDCLNRAHRFSAPEKVNAWLCNGSRKRRLPKTILQPSGHVTKAQKKVGHVLAIHGKRQSRR